MRVVELRKAEKEIVTSLQEVADALLGATSASRITIRLADPENPYYPVKAEALAPGVRSILEQTNPLIAEAPTFQHIVQTQSILVQDDVRTSPPLFPELIDLFESTAQMLAPIIRNGDAVGAISVHWNNGSRNWTAEDRAALENAQAQVGDVLEKAVWP
jgi:GAF domain-containing protein